MNEMKDWNKNKLKYKWISLGLREDAINYGLDILEMFSKNQNNIIHKIPFYLKKEEFPLDLALTITYICYRNKMGVRTTYEVCKAFGLNNNYAKDYSKDILKNAIIISKNLGIHLNPILKFDFLERYLYELKIFSSESYEDCIKIIAKDWILKVSPNPHIMTLAVIYYVFNKKSKITYDTLEKFANTNRGTIRNAVKLIEEIVKEKGENGSNNI